MKRFVTFLLFVLGASGANAALLHWDVRESDFGQYVVNDLTICFDGQLFGQQLVLMLDAGSIYQDPFGGETAPNDAFFGVAPTLEYDTFLTIGGTTSVTSEDVLVVGGSTELGFNTGKKFDTTGINVAWAPAPGVVVNGGANYPIARITLSPDADGTVLFFSNSGGVPTIRESKISGGYMGHFGGNYDCPFPEPTTGTLLLLSGAAVLIRPNWGRSVYEFG